MGVGIGLKPQHYADLLAGPAIPVFVEIHAENYMGAGGPPHHYLGQIRERCALSVHGVGLSLGGAARPDPAHLTRLAALCERYAPESFSEHLAWSSHGGAFLNDLLPLPYDDTTLARLGEHVNELQHALRRRVLIENPATYVAFDRSFLAETDFLAALARRTGCGLLLDVNNVHVSAVNHGFDATSYIDAFPVEHVGEIHLAGFAVDADDEGRPLLIDNHGAAVDDAVWGLYERCLARCGLVPTLVEWDNAVPALPVLLGEANKAADALRAEAARRNRGRAA